jgi:transcriptional regulator with XRE-family HTH domain
MNKVKYGALIKAVRNSKGLKAKWIAEKIGVSISTYTEIEANRRSITLERAEKIASAMGMTLEELLRQQVSDTLTA